MAKGVFTARVDPAYDDLPEMRYHFPRRYLGRTEACVGDWILYYEPKRGGGRRSYFATARITHIAPDATLPDHFYAYVDDYLEFPNPVPYRVENRAFESALILPSGGVNHGLFQWAVHHLPEHEYHTIVTAGLFGTDRDPKAEERDIKEEVLEVNETEDRIYDTLLTVRARRDAAFSQLIRSAYDDRCAFTGLCLRNGGGSCEVEAAHIKPVSLHGPDSVRNGLALSRTFHWMFDRGILALDDDWRILRAAGLVPEPLQELIAPEYAFIPEDDRLRPHKLFLRYHREHIFKG